jgi:hypothetical protein
MYVGIEHMFGVHNLSSATSLFLAPFSMLPMTGFSLQRKLFFFVPRVTAL